MRSRKNFRRATGAALLFLLAAVPAGAAQQDIDLATCSGSPPAEFDIDAKVGEPLDLPIGLVNADGKVFWAFEAAPPTSCGAGPTAYRCNGVTLGLPPGAPDQPVAASQAVTVAGTPDAPGWFPFRLVVTTADASRTCHRLYRLTIKPDEPARLRFGWSRVVGAREFRGLLQHRNVELTRLDGLTAEDLQGLDGLFLGLSIFQVERFLYEEIRSVHQFVDAGGSLVVMTDGQPLHTGHPLMGWSDANAADLNRLIAVYGVTFRETRTESPSVTITRFAAHPLTEGVSQLEILNHRRLERIQPPAKDLTVEAGEQDAVAVVDGHGGSGCVALFSTPWLDPGGVDPNDPSPPRGIRVPGNRRMAENLIAYLRSPACLRAGAAQQDIDLATCSASPPAELVIDAVAGKPLDLPIGLLNARGDVFWAFEAAPPNCGAGPTAYRCNGVTLELPPGAPDQPVAASRAVTVAGTPDAPGWFPFRLVVTTADGARTCQRLYRLTIQPGELSLGIDGRESWLNDELNTVFSSIRRRLHVNRTTLTSFTATDLAGLDALLLTLSRDVVFSVEEIEAIHRFVGTGGSLVVAAESLGDEHVANLNRLVEVYGAAFRETAPGNERPSITQWRPHPLTAGVSRLQIRHQRRLDRIEPPAIDLTVEGGEQDALAVVEGRANSGCVVLLSDTTWFRDLDIEDGDNRRMAENLLTYLKSPACRRGR